MRELTNNSMDIKSKRVKYIRALEKCSRRFVNILKNKDFNIENLQNSSQSVLQYLSQIEKVNLTSTYTRELEKFIYNCCSLKYEQKELTLQFNYLDKLKKTNKYKKEKYKIIDFE